MRALFDAVQDDAPLKVDLRWGLLVFVGGGVVVALEGDVSGGDYGGDVLD